MKRYTLFLALIVALVALPGCHKAPQIPSTPTIDTTVENGLQAARLKAATILEASSALMAQASQYELDGFRQGLIPANIHQPLDAGFVRFATKHKAAIAWLREHPTSDWQSVKGQIDPLIDDVRALMAAFNNAGPSVGQRILGILGSVLSIYLEAQGFGGGRL